MSDQLRIKEHLEIAYGSLPPELRQTALADGFYDDISQCVTRARWGGRIKTLCTSTILYDLGQQRFLSGVEHTALQGMPCELKFCGMSQHKQREVAGEAFFLPSMASIMMAVLLNPLSPWWVQPGESSGGGPCPKRPRAS
jgi:hypothetical protein